MVVAKHGKKHRLRRSLAQERKLRKIRQLPGFSLSLGITMSWVGFIIVLPLLALFWKASAVPLSKAWELLSRPAALASFRITFGYAFLAASINSVMGLIVAWTLLRHPFRGSGALDALVDMPFALPGAVGGIALANIFDSNGLLGQWLDLLGIRLIYNQTGILIGLIFVTLPFAVRSIQPLIRDLNRSEEQAALLLGAGPLQVFLRVQLPYLWPGIASGFILAFARSLGEYGTVIFVAGNLPLKSEVISRYIYNKIDQYDLLGGTVVAAVLLVLSLLFIATFNAIEAHRRSHYAS